jgi:hypothetical protein
MTIHNLGRIGLVSKGEWSPAETYHNLDIVGLDNSLFICFAPSTSLPPTDTSAWHLYISDSGAEAASQRAADSEAIAVVSAEAALLSKNVAAANATSAVQSAAVATAQADIAVNAIATVQAASATVASSVQSVLTAATAAVNAPNTTATSSSVLTPSLSTITLALNETGKLYTVGQTVNISTPTGSTVMVGIITQFTGVIMMVNVNDYIGGGQHNNWFISVGGLSTVTSKYVKRQINKLKLLGL